MNRVLILEDEGMLRASMAKGIGKLPEVEVVDAGTFAEALRFIDEKPPQLILSDLDLPDRSGLELLGALGARGLRVPIIFISAYLKAYGGQIPPHANVEVREKPIALEELRKLVKQHLGVTERSPFSVADYLQIASMGQHSVEITLQWDEGHHGRIVVVNGQLWGSEDSWGMGAESFKRLAMATDVAIACTALRGDPGDRNITGSLEHMLLEAAQYQDEMGRGNEFENFLEDSGVLDSTFAPEPSAQENRFPPPNRFPSPPPVATAAPARAPAPPAPPPPAPEPPPPPPPPADDFKTWFTKANEAILDKNYEEALEYLRKAEAMEPDNPKVQRLINKLEKKG